MGIHTRTRWGISLRGEYCFSGIQHGQPRNPAVHPPPAAETAIWLTEAAPHSASGKKILTYLESASHEANPQLSRLALKLATGAGKTTVMAMLIAWQTINAVRRENSKMFTRGFLIIAPGLTIKDRLSVMERTVYRIRSGKFIRIAQGAHHGRPGSFVKMEGMEPVDVFYTALGEPLELFLKHGQDLLFSSWKFDAIIRGGQGAARKREDGSVIRRGLSEKVRDKLTSACERRVRAEVLMRRVAHFMRGMMFGSREFVDGWFEVK